VVVWLYDAVTNMFSLLVNTHTCTSDCLDIYRGLVF